MEKCCQLKINLLQITKVVHVQRMHHLHQRAIKLNILLIGYAKNDFMFTELSKKDKRIAREIIAKGWMKILNGGCWNLKLFCRNGEANPEITGNSILNFMDR
jgi:hypothetical protein